MQLRSFQTQTNQINQNSTKDQTDSQTLSEILKNVMLDQTSRQGAIAKLAKLVIMDQAIVDQIENQNQLLVIIADEIKVQCIKMHLNHNQSNNIEQTDILHACIQTLYSIFYKSQTQTKLFIVERTSFVNNLCYVINSDDGEEESADILSFAILALRVIHSSLVRIMHESSSIHFEMKVLSIIRNMEELLEKAGSIEDVNAALFRDNSDEDGVVDEAIYFTGQLQGFLRFS